MLKRPQILVFDEAISSLDAGTAEQIARTVNALKGRVSILFITHQVPRTLKVDSIFELGRIGGDEKRFGVIQGGPPPQGARE